MLRHEDMLQYKLNSAVDAAYKTLVQYLRKVLERSFGAENVYSVLLSDSPPFQSDDVLKPRFHRGNMPHATCRTLLHV
jgi:hypothetical protein